MLAVVSDEVKERLMPIFEKLGLPTEYDGDIDIALDFAGQDKKADGAKIEMVFVDEVGKYRLEKVDAAGMAALAKAAYGKK
jgi:3-dehydroquinate synthetase